MRQKVTEPRVTPATATEDDWKRLGNWMIDFDEDDPKTWIVPGGTSKFFTRIQYGADNFLAAEVMPPQ